MPTVSKEDPNAEYLQSVGTTVLAALREMHGSMEVFSNHLQVRRGPLDRDVYDRLAALVPSMLATGEQLCRKAESLIDMAGHPAVPNVSTRAQYEEMADAIVEIRRVSKLLLVEFRPQTPDQQEAMAIIEAASARSKILR